MKSLTTITIAAALLVALSSLNSCNKKDEEPIPSLSDEIELTAEQKQIVEAGNEFAIDAFKAINDSNDNVLIAPYSMQLSLAMLANGADSATLAEISNLLHTGSSISALNEHYKSLTASLVNADKRVNLKFTNALWTATGFTPFSSFTSALSNYYSAPCSSIDFTSDKALSTINGWVSDATDGKISQLFKSLSPTTQTCLVSAMSFDGKWKSEFDPKRTCDKQFKNWRGELETCKTMITDYMASGMIYYGTEANILRIYYGSSSYGFDIIVPNDGKNINDFITELSIQKVNEIYKSRKFMQTDHVELPKFKKTFDYNLIEGFKKMGFLKIFAGGLSGICGAPLSVSQFVQQTAIEVDESGSKVDTSTGSTTDPTGFGGPDAYINEPFVYLIRERSTGAILLIGKVQTMAGMQ